MDWSWRCSWRQTRPRTASRQQAAPIQPLLQHPKPKPVSSPARTAPEQTVAQRYVPVPSGAASISVERATIALGARTNEPHTLYLLVEAMGQVSFGSSMGERKGITEKVELRDDLGRREIYDWEIFPVRLESADRAALRFETFSATPEVELRENLQPAVYRSSFQLGNALVIVQGDA